jgi:hypothetical protein
LLRLLLIRFGTVPADPGGEQLLRRLGLPEFPEAAIVSAARQTAHEARRIAANIAKLPEMLSARR